MRVSYWVDLRFPIGFAYPLFLFKEIKMESKIQVFRICNHCNKEHPVSMSVEPDALYANVYDCPLCGKRNDLWIRIVLAPAAAPAVKPDSPCDLICSANLDGQCMASDYNTCRRRTPAKADKTAVEYSCKWCGRKAISKMSNIAHEASCPSKNVPAAKADKPITSVLYDDVILYDAIQHLKISIIELRDRVRKLEGPQ